MPCQNFTTTQEKAAELSKVTAGGMVDTMVQTCTYWGANISVAGCYVLITYVNSSHFYLRGVIQGMHKCWGKRHMHLRAI
jgi:hypothetical protein